MRMLQGGRERELPCNRPATALQPATCARALRRRPSCPLHAAPVSSHRLGSGVDTDRADAAVAGADAAASSATIAAQRRFVRFRRLIAIGVAIPIAAIVIAIAVVIAG
eukprot:scaffold75708_cov46-Phaeocystis_antarctica.AAC.1